MTALDARTKSLAWYRAKPTTRNLLRSHLALAVRRAAGSVLFALDNLPEATTEETEHLLGTVPSEAHVTATSRRELSVGAVELETLRIEPLDLPAGAALLARNVAERGDIADWHPVVDWVGGLPLALDLLNRALVARATSRRDLLERARSAGDGAAIIDEYVCAIQSLLPAGRVSGIGQAFGLSFDLLTNAEKAAATALAWLAPAPIPLSLVDNLAALLPPALRATLAARSFVTPASGRISTFGCMHRLLAAYLRARTVDPPVLLAQLARFLAAAVNNFQLDEALSEATARSPHYRSLFEHLLTRQSDVGTQLLVQFGLETALVAGAGGEHTTARSVYEQCLAASQEHRPKTKDRLALELAYASARERDNDPEIARKLVASLLGEDSLTAVPVLHADALLLATKLRLGRGDVDGTVEDLTHAMQLVRGAIEAKTALDRRAMTDLAQAKLRLVSMTMRAFIARGQVAAARWFFEAETKRLVPREGRDGLMERLVVHPFRMQIEHALEHWAPLLELCRSYSADIATLMPPTSPQRIDADVGLAYILVEAGRVEEARQVFARLLSITPGLLVTHPTALRTFARVSAASGHSARAAEIWRLAEKVSSGIDKLEAGINRGEVLLRLGRLDDAREAIGHAVESLDPKATMLHVTIRHALAAWEAIERPPNHVLAGETRFGDFELDLARCYLAGLADAPIPLVLLEATEPFVFTPGLRAVLLRAGVLTSASNDAFVLHRDALAKLGGALSLRPEHLFHLRQAVEFAAKQAGPSSPHAEALALHAQRVEHASTGSSLPLAGVWQSVRRWFS